MFFKLWADIVKENLLNLKKLNPRSQNLQVFYKNKEQTNKLEINECKLKKSVINENSAFIISKYVSKYNSGLNNKEIIKMIEQKKNHLINRNLFQFSRSCKKLSIINTLKFLPFDLGYSKYHLTSIYLKNILDFPNKHPLFELLRNDILKQNNKKACFKTCFGENSKESIDFEKNKKKYLLKYIKNKGKLSFFFMELFFIQNNCLKIILIVNLIIRHVYC